MSFGIEFEGAVRVFYTMSSPIAIPRGRRAELGCWGESVVWETAIPFVTKSMFK